MDSVSADIPPSQSSSVVEVSSDKHRFSRETCSGDGGYQTRQGSSSSSIARNYLSEYSWNLEEEVEFCEELEDNVFACEEMKSRGLVHEEVDSRGSILEAIPVVRGRRGRGVDGRSRAFSFPMTVADVRFHVPLTSFCSSLVGQTSYHSFLSTASGGSSSLHLYAGDGGDPDEESLIDDVDSRASPVSVHHDGRGTEEKAGDEVVDINCASPASSCDNSDGDLDLPDIILSGSRPRSPSSHSLCVTDLEFKIARRLAKIGDEFDLKFSLSKSGGNTPDSGLGIANIGLNSATRFWNYVTKPAQKSPAALLTRQRSRSTVD